MSEAVKNRAASIRHYLRDDAIDPALLFSYSVTAARWEATRLLIDRGSGTPADDRRFWELSRVLRGLTEAVGLGTCSEENKGADGVPGLTWPGGWLPRDPSRIICDDWREAAVGW